MTRLYKLLRDAPMDRFRLAAAALEDFSDIEIEKLFLALEISDERDISEVVRIIVFYRPELFKKITDQCCQRALR